MDGACFRFASFKHRSDKGNDMELQDLKLNPTDIRDNIQINGPSSAVKNRDKLLARYKDDAEKLAHFEQLP